MPLHDAIILGAIISVFAAFGLLLGGASFYCRDRADKTHRSQRSKDAYPPNSHIITDDD